MSRSSMVSTLYQFGKSTDFVAGFNLPMAITLSASDCHTASFPADLNPNCPAELQQLWADGSVVGCKSACYANLDGNQ